MGYVVVVSIGGVCLFVWLVVVGFLYCILVAGWFVTSSWVLWVC